MAKSKILKELANNEVPLDVALKRLLLICDDLGYKELFSWAEKELNGYFGEESVPEYRNIGMGQILYSGLKGSMISHLKLTNQPFPIQWIPSKFMDYVCNNYERSTIANIVERAKTTTSTYSVDLTSIAGFVEVGIAFTSITQKFDSSSYAEIVNKLSNILLKIFMKLDKEYGNLDELDIDVSGKEKAQIISFERQLIVEIGEINFISIGDGNTIKNSKVGMDQQ